MRKHIFTLMALVAALCACNKEQMSESEVTEPVVESSAPLVFTATMEGAPASKATFDNTAKCASWEVGDQVNINGFSYEANAAGASTTFSMVGGGPAHEIRPVFVSTTTPDSYTDNNHNSFPPSNLVDAAGTETRWCAHTDHKVDGVWNIVVSTGSNTLLKTIKLWNADNSTYPNRRWKRIQLYGRSKTSDAWEIIGSYNNLNLAINNKGFAGEIEVNSSSAYTFYKIDVLDNEGDSYMQMSDMKFTVEPAAPYHAYFPASLYNGEQTVLPASISETWAEGKFNMPMYAQSSSPELQFKNLCGVLKITVKNDVMPKVKSIRISSLNKATSGAFTVINNAAVLDSPDAASNTVTVTYTDAVSTSAEGTVFYIAIPPQSYRALRIELSADGNDFTKLMTTKKNVEITVARSKIYPITFSMDDLTTGMEIATINGSEVYVPWVQLWKDGPKFAKFNVGAEYNNESDYGSYLMLGQFDNNGSYSWGNKWRVPKSSELSELMANCNSSWTTIPGTPGRLYTGKGEYSNNSIFLPAAGYYDRPSGTLLDKDTLGKYWSSTDKSHTAYGPEYLYCLVFTSSNQNIGDEYRVRCLSIRPVLAE